MPSSGSSSRLQSASACSTETETEIETEMEKDDIPCSNGLDAYTDTFSQVKGRRFRSDAFGRPLKPKLWILTYLLFLMIPCTKKRLATFLF